MQNVETVKHFMTPLPWILCEKRLKTKYWVATDYYGFSISGGYEKSKLLYVENSSWLLSLKNLNNSGRILRPNDVLLDMNG